jgi:hypothetical protein
MRRYLVIFEMSIYDKDDGECFGAPSVERQIECEANDLGARIAIVKSEIEAKARIVGRDRGCYAIVALKQVLPL